MSRLTCSAVVLLLAACGAPPPPPMPPQAGRPVVEVERWLCRLDGQVVAVVRRLEIRDPTGPLPYYRIEDQQGRWLGHASDGLRFRRRVPFRDEEQDLGVWSLAGGVRLLLEASGPIELVAQPLDAAKPAR